MLSAQLYGDASRLGLIHTPFLLLLSSIPWCGRTPPVFNHSHIGVVSHLGLSECSYCDHSCAGFCADVKSHFSGTTTWECGFSRMNTWECGFWALGQLHVEFLTKLPNGPHPFACLPAVTRGSCCSTSLLASGVGSVGL